MDLVVIGTPGCRRGSLFQAALARLGHRPARVVSYLDLLEGRSRLSDVVAPGAVVRIESPGKEFEVERAFLAAGEDEAEAEGAARISRRAVAALTFDRGRLLYPRQWYFGFCRALALIEAQLATCPAHRRMNSPADIVLMFDKVRCHRLLADARIPVPHGLGVAASFEDLWQRMRASGCLRVFVKLAHGSCASGVVAYQSDGVRHLATTTVERVRDGDEWRLYNSRRLRQYRQPAEIAALIDALCRHRVHVEEWLPKAGSRVGPSICGSW